MRDRERGYKYSVVCSSYLLFSAIPTQYFAKQHYISSLITVGKYTFRSYNACNRQTRLDRPVRREEKIRTYICTGLRTPGLNLSVQNAISKIHTDDESNLD